MFRLQPNKTYGTLVFFNFLTIIKYFNLKDKKKDTKIMGKMQENIF